MAKEASYTSFQRFDEQEEPSAKREATVLLVDWSREGEIVASLHAPSVFAPGAKLKQLLPTGDEISSWVTEQLYGEQWERLCIPSGGHLWYVDTRLYLSTGFLLWICCPARAMPSAPTIVSLVKSGIWGKVALFEEGLSSLSDRAEAAISSDAIRLLADCVNLPNACLTGWDGATGENLHEGLAELVRLSREAADFAGISCLVQNRILTMMCSGTVEDYDFAMAAAMLLTLMFALSRHGIGEVTVTPEVGEEGMVLDAKAPGEGIAEWQALPELLACRRLAERNHQIFECTLEQGQLHLRFCTVRKDYALLGVKADPRLC